MNADLEQLTADRVEWLRREFTSKAWPKSDGYFQRCFEAQERGEMVVLVARAGEELHGYLKVVWVSDYPPFLEHGIPEIQDLNVVPAARRQGVASRLMDRAEALIACRSMVAGIGVGLHPGYGAAQRLYVKRGYVPDGLPLMFHDAFVKEGQDVRLDDELVLHLTKTLLSREIGPTDTGRVRLRPITPDDVDNLLLIFADPAAMEFWPALKTRDEIGRSVERIQQSYRENGYGLWAAELKETGEFIGRVGLIRQDDVAGQTEIEVGYALVPKFWKRGYATEAAMACRDWAFQHLDCERVVSLVHTINLPSCRVAERNGMRVVAELARWNLPHFVYAITRAEWGMLRKESPCRNCVTG